MPRKRHTPEQIISKLREAEVGLASGQTVPEVCRTLGIAEQTYYRWRKEYGGLKVEQARRFPSIVFPPSLGQELGFLAAASWIGSSGLAPNIEPQLS